MSDDHAGLSLSATSARVVEAGDLNEITYHVNGLVLDGNWEELDRLRQRCRLAFARGRQLWPAASYIEYRLSLEGPGPWAAAMVEQAEGRFALGPLPEVAASRHSWAELAPFLQASPQAAMAAHERVARGEDLSADPLAQSLPEVLDLPLALAPWEPDYTVPVYHPDHVEAPMPTLPALRNLGGADTADRAASSAGSPPAAAPAADDVGQALSELVGAWVTESNGRALTASVVGSAVEAMEALGARPRQSAPLSAPQAFDLMAWAASTGGAHGRRKGAAPGRYGAWCVGAALAGTAGQWPLPEGPVGRAAQAANWYWWSDGPGTGWRLYLAVEMTEGPCAGRAWALAANDAD